jgi:hypothetical protein
MRNLVLGLFVFLGLASLAQADCDRPPLTDAQIACGACPANATAAHRSQVSFAGISFGYGFCQIDTCSAGYELYKGRCAPPPVASWFSANSSFADGEYQVLVRAQLDRPTTSAMAVQLFSIGDPSGASSFDLPDANAHFQAGQYVSDPIAINLHRLSTSTDKVARLALAGSAASPLTITILSSVKSLPNTYWIATASGASSADSPTVVSDPSQAIAMTVNFSQMQSRVFPTAWKVSVGTFAPITGLLLAGQTSFDFSVGTDILAALPASPAQVAVTVAGSNALAGGSVPGAIEAQAAPACAPDTEPGASIVLCPMPDPYEYYIYAVTDSSAAAVAAAAGSGATISTPFYFVSAGTVSTQSAEVSARALGQGLAGLNPTSSYVVLLATDGAFSPFEWFMSFYPFPAGIPRPSGRG